MFEVEDLRDEPESGFDPDPLSYGHLNHWWGRFGMSICSHLISNAKNSSFKFYLKVHKRSGKGFAILHHHIDRVQGFELSPFSLSLNDGISTPNFYFFCCSSFCCSLDYIYHMILLYLLTSIHNSLKSMNKFIHGEVYSTSGRQHMVDPQESWWPKLTQI